VLVGGEQGFGDDDLFPEDGSPAVSNLHGGDTKSLEEENCSQEGRGHFFRSSA